MGTWKILFITALAISLIIQKTADSKNVNAADAIVHEGDAKVRKLRQMRNELKTASEIEEIFSDSNIRQRRSYKFDNWINNEQKEAIKKMQSEQKSPQEIKSKILEFFNLLPSDEKEKWNIYYKEHCIDWIKKVTDENEMKELKEIWETKKMEELFVKLDEYKKRLSDEERERTELWRDVCQRLWGIEEKMNSIKRLRRDLLQYNPYTSSIKNEQLEELEKVKDFNDDLPDENDKIRQMLNEKCFSWLQTVATDDEVNQLRESYLFADDESAYRIRFMHLFGRLLPTLRKRYRKITDMCYELSRNCVRSKRDLKDYEKWISWMDENQKTELMAKLKSGEPFEKIHGDMDTEFKKLSEEKRKNLISIYKENCKEYFKKFMTPNEIEDFKEMHVKNDKENIRKTIEIVIARQPDDVKMKARRFKLICENVYHKIRINQSRRRRDINNLIEKHLSWLTNSQKQEISDMKNSGKSRNEIKTKLLGYIKNMGNEDKKEVTQRTKESCYSWLDEITTKEERNELERLHMSDHAACKRKIRDYIKRLSHAKQEAINRDLDICEGIWYTDHASHGNSQSPLHNHRRYVRELDTFFEGMHQQKSIINRSHHTYRQRLDHCIKKYLKWMSDEQKQSIRELKESGKPREEIENEIIKFYNFLDNGNKYEQMVEDYKGFCQTVFTSSIRTKRDHHHDHNDLEDYFKTHLSWLNDDQMNEIRKMKSEGKPKGEMQKKVLEYFNALPSDKKKEADNQLKEACRELTAHVFGQEKAKILKTMKDEGKDVKEIKAKAEEMVSEVTDEHKKQMVEDYKGFCKNVFLLNTHLKVKRDSQTNFDHYFLNLLSWLTTEQKEELQRIKSSPESRVSVQGKILEFFNEASGERKELATVSLQQGCLAVIEDLAGNDKVVELKAMRDSGVTHEELDHKVNEIIEGISDESKKALALSYSKPCKIIYGIGTARLKRAVRLRSVNLKDIIIPNKSWMDSNSKEELISMKNVPKDEFVQMLMNFYFHTENMEKLKIAKELYSLCESGIIPDGIFDLKVNHDVIIGVINEISVTNVNNVMEINNLKPICQKIFQENFSNVEVRI